MFGDLPIYSFAVVRSSGTGLMLMTADKCDAAGYENPKPLCGKRERIPPTNAAPPTLGAEVDRFCSLNDG